MRKWFIIAGILLAVSCGVWIISKAATPIITERKVMLIDRASAGVGETYRELCGFAAGQWHYRKWYRDHDFIARVGCIVADQPHVKIRGSLRPSGKSTLLWTCSVGAANADDGNGTPKATFTIEYDLAKGTVALVNTGQTFPIVEDMVYMLYVDEQFNIEKFAVLERGSQLANVHPQVSAMFSSTMSTIPRP